MANKKICYCNQNHEECIRKVPIFNSLTDFQIKKVTSLIVKKNYPKGSKLYLEGSYPQHLVIINKGKVKAFRNNYEGKEQIAYIFTAGDFFGVMNLLLEREARFTLEALEDTGVCMISKSSFNELLLEYPEIAIEAIKEICIRLDKMETLVHNIGSRDADTRMYMMLLEFAKKFGNSCDDGIIIELPLNREEMANYIGVTRETISRKLAALQAEGLIRLMKGRKILIMDKNKLEDLIFGKSTHSLYPNMYI